MSVKTLGASTSAIAVRSENGPINVLRAFSAVVVVLQHARTLFMADFDEVPQNAIQTVLYGISSLGHQAVVVFFVLSGFWVGGTMVRHARSDRFSWSNYLTNRLVRMWVVALPALALTFCLDLIGRQLYGSMSTYAGDVRYGGVAMDQRPIDGITILGNALFIQAIHVPTLGSNTALWSLSYELWLYILAPLVFLALWKRSRASLGYGFLAVAVGVFVGVPVLAYLPLWALGAGVFLAQPLLTRTLNQLTPWQVALIRGLAAAMTLAACVAVRGLNSLPTIVGDYIVAVPAALLTATLVTGFRPGGTGEKLLTPYSRLASSSFSLYAIHLPILVLTASMIGVQVDDRWPSDPAHWALLFAIIAGILALGWLFAQGTEKHTNAVRDFVNARLSRSTRWRTRRKALSRPRARRARLR